MSFPFAAGMKSIGGIAMSNAKPRQRGDFKPKLIALSVAACFSLSTAQSLANPTGGTVSSGSASFASSGNTLTITNSANAIINRDTTDYNFNFAVNPSFHLGNNVFSLSAGIQRTLRRDSQDPIHMNQNLFRQYVYLSTSSFYNWLSLKGYAIHESGPFTQSNLRSRDLAGALEFSVGRPWGKTALITGWGARDEQFSPLIREFYYTSTYAGIERQFSQNFHLRAVGEYLRSWRVEEQKFAIAQAFRPAANIDYRIGHNWDVEASFAYSRNMGFHLYDAVESGFSVSYAMPVGRTFEENGQKLPLRYPIRFSAGLQQETFFNFSGGNKSQQFRPFIRISLF